MSNRIIRVVPDVSPRGHRTGKIRVVIPGGPKGHHTRTRVFDSASRANDFASRLGKRAGVPVETTQVHEAGAASGSTKRSLRGISAARKAHRNQEIKSRVVLAEDRDVEDDDEKHVTFVVSGAGARDWARFQQSIDSTNWEADGPDFAYAVVGYFDDEDRNRMFREVRKEGYVLRLVEDYIPRHFQSPRLARHTARIEAARRAAADRRRRRGAAARSGGATRPAGGDARYRYVPFGHLTASDQAKARDQYPHGSCGPTESYLYPIKKTGRLAYARRYLPSKTGRSGRSTGATGRKIVATSFERYNGGVRVKRAHGSSTVTRFYVHFADEEHDPSKWKEVEGYGPTPGDRKTDAIRRSGLLEG